MANKQFSAKIDAWAQETEKRMTRVVQASTMEVADRASVPTAKGGRMRVKTGFLRASGQFSFNGLPTGPVRPDAEKTYPDADAPNLSEPSILVVAKLRLGQTIFFGWTANYAKYREHFDGFLRTATQQWQQIVDEKVKEVKQRVTGR